MQASFDWSKESVHMFARSLITVAVLAAGGFPPATLRAQDLPPLPESNRHEADAPAPGEYTLAAGTKVPLSLINSVSTKHSAEGDNVYLETVYPIMANGRIVLPVGSYVVGTVTQVRRPGRVKGRGEFYVRFDSL